MMADRSSCATTTPGPVLDAHAIHTELCRSQNLLRMIEERMTPEQRAHAANVFEEKRRRAEAAKSAMLSGAR
jgi:hypothetical protein